MLILSFLKAEQLKKIFGLFVLLIIGANGTAKADLISRDEAGFKKEISNFNSFLQTEFGVKIHLSKDWSSATPTFSASAMSLEGKVIRISGYDYQSNSLGAFRLGLCHEAGHYLAGSPFLRVGAHSIESSLNRMDLSAEGQADYFASYCLKKYSDYLTDHGGKALSANPSADIVDFCRSSNDKSKCEYVSTAALDLVNYLNNERTKNSAKPSMPIKFVDYKNVGKSEHTLDARREYPSLNCRLATYLAGTLCPNDNAGLNQFVCHSGEGARPDCWYVEK